MALSKLEIGFFRRALLAGAIPACDDILEFGEFAAVKGARSLLELLGDAVVAERRQQAETAIADAELSITKYRQAFGPARALYHAIFGPHTYLAVDLALGPGRLCLDLNQPLKLGRQFSATINNGTSEHVFDQANVFRSMHDHTRAGGIMVHWTPCIGFVDHGFYNVQPGLFFDLAAANGYQMRHLELAGLNDAYPIRERDDHRAALREFPSLANSLICAVLAKLTDHPFTLPMQGMWADGAPISLAHRLRERTRDSRSNHALNRPARQSSTCSWSRHDDPTVDARGGNNGIITGFYGFHTDEEDSPWWEVDLGTVKPVSEVVVYNRIDRPGVAARAMRLKIAVSDDADAWRSVYERTDVTIFGGADGNPLRVGLRDTHARYVRLALAASPKGKSTLHLDEVEVY